MKKVNSPPHGAIAQLGERIVRNDEVVGSIPTSSTISFNYLVPLFLITTSSKTGEFWNVNGMCFCPDASAPFLWSW
jgi:hypothetical protein